ncbi:MAG: hypothetical protein KJN67_05440 [Pontiella sp.]|nr:hypothetical protein [Pontiella sp.]
MHENGDLFEKYNNRRKSAITQLSVCLAAIGGLSYYELSRLRMKHRRRLGFNPFPTQKKENTQGPVKTCIYEAPETKEDWEGAEMRDMNLAAVTPGRYMPELWMGLLRICCILMPIIYVGLLLISRAGMMGNPDTVWLLTSFFATMTVFSLVTAIGIFRRAFWGMTAGYLLAISNLLIFPYGTVLGLFLLIGLVGSKTLFIIEKRVKRRKKRRARREKRKLRNERRRRKTERKAAV